MNDIAAKLVLEARTRAGLSQRELAVRAGTAQSVVARIERGHSEPSLHTLVKLLTAAAFELTFDLTPSRTTDPVINAYKRDIDRSLLRENLRRTPEQRVRSLAALAQFAAEARRAGRVAESSP